MLALQFGDIDRTRRLTVRRGATTTLQAAVERLEAGKAFDVVTEATDNLSAEAVSRHSAKAEVSRILQVPPERSLADDSDVAGKTLRSH